MKSMMSLGAITGFLLGAASSYAGNCTGPMVFWHACVTAAVGGFLARWWGKMWFEGLAAAMEQQRRARIQASETKTSAKA
ncbi:MAG TPA: hypothetical protein VF988_16465 [Verrucomicrobiae bacterium]